MSNTPDTTPGNTSEESDSGQSESFSKKRMMAEYLTSMGRDEEAAQLYDEYIAELRQLLGPSSLDLADELYMIGATLSLKEKHEKAIEILLKALQAQKENLGCEHRDLVFTLDSIARSTRALGQLQKAKQANIQAVGLLELSYNATHWSLAGYLQQLVEICRDLGEEQEAAEYEKRLKGLTQPSREEQEVMLMEHAARFERLLARSMEGLGGMVKHLTEGSQERES